MRSLPLILLLILAGASHVCGQACTIQVPAGSPTIQVAIDGAMDGEVICVAPGTYVENLNFLGKAITVRSTNGPAVTTINGSATGAAVTFNTNEGPGTVLSGFTIINGDPEILCQASPVIQNNTINSVDTAVRVYNYGTPNTPDPRIQDNTISGVIHLVASTSSPDNASVAATIVNNTVSGFIDVGAFTASCNYYGIPSAAPTISNNTVTGSNFAGFSIDLCSYAGYLTGTIANNTLMGGGIHVAEDGDCGVALATISQNTVPAGGISIGGFATASVDGNTITNSSGAGVSFRAVGSLTLSNNTISGSDPGVHVEVGGGYSNDACLLNNLVTGNSTGVNFEIPSGQDGQMDSLLVNNTISGNSGPGVSAECRGNDSDLELAVKNSIIWGNGGGSLGFSAVPNCVFTPEISFSNIEGGYPGTGNLSANPLFVSNLTGDFYLSQIAAGQAANSPCVNAGDPASPLLVGTTRTDNVLDESIIDMGFHHSLFFVRGDCDGSGSVPLSLPDATTALEFQFILGTPPPPCLAACDATGDHVFNGLADAIWILNFLFLQGPPPTSPFPRCGTDSNTVDAVGCDAPTCP